MPEIAAEDGVSIHYEVWGRRAATPVLLIQGLGADSRAWALQRMAFGRRHRCYAPDNRGVGQSDRPPGPYSLEQMAADVLAVLDREEVESAHVVGASMGGVIAQILGVLHPDRVRSLTLACTACRHHQWRRELLAEWAGAVAADGTSALGREALAWLVGPRLHRRFGVWLNVMARVLLQTPPEPFVAQVAAILDAPDDIRFALAEITVPTLIITGSQDSLTPVGDAEELAELIPHARLEVVTGAAHGLMVEAPNAFNDSVLRFLDTVDDAATRTASDATAAESA